MNQRGSTIVESMMCIMLLCLVFFGLLQIFQWSVAKMLCEYSSFYATKGRALGYANSIILRGAQIAATGASGQDNSQTPAPAPFTRQELSSRAEDYMLYSSYGTYGVNYEYWDPADTNTPMLEINHWSFGDFAGARVWINNMPLLSPALSPFTGGAENADIPAGESAMFDHSQLYLEN